MFGEDFFIAITAIGVFVVVPVIAMVMHHQRKMAVIVRKNAGPDEEARARIERLENEVQELRTRQAEVIVRLDDATEVQRRIES